MRDLQWKTVSSEYLFNDRWFKVRKDRCVTPSGTVVDPYYVYEFPTWVGAVPVTEDGKVIMVRQYRHALGEVVLEIPGGCVDDSDSSLEAAAARELLEEFEIRQPFYFLRNGKRLGFVFPDRITGVNGNSRHILLFYLDNIQ